MKNFTEVFAEQLQAMSQAKRENFGGIPDDFRQMNEEILGNPEIAVNIVGRACHAASKLPEFARSLIDSGGGEIIDKIADRDSESVLMKMDALEKSFPSLVRKNWKLFEPAFLMLYLGTKIGRQQEREEREELDSFARAEARRERQRENPNAFDTITEPALSAHTLTDGSDPLQLPEISDEKAAIFRQELDAELRRQKRGDEGNQN